MTSPNNRTLKNYEPSLDGLRALAVMGVVAYHIWPVLIPGGWIGVDIFFVLSGYLITSLLNREINYSDNIEFKSFYIRRFLRLTPALWVLFAFIIITAILFSSNRLEEFRSVLISGLYLMNWNRAFNVFPTGLLAHTWSLSMEEQFYLLWPSVLLFITRRQPIRWTVAIIALITTWRMYLVFSGADSDRTYNGFDTHGDALLIGCLLALAPMTARTVGIARMLVALPIAGVMLMLGRANLQTLFTQTIGLTLASMLAAWLIIAALQQGWLHQLLSIRPLVYTGRISYGWYLWHGPLLLLGTKSPLLQGGLGKTVIVILAYLVAACSYQLIERPFLRLKSQFEPKEAQWQKAAATVAYSK